MTRKQENVGAWKEVCRYILKWFVLPFFIYIVLFFLFQPNHLTNFSSSFYLDAGDGFQNVWNIWWVNTSLGQSGSSPYYTTMLHAPHGTSLIPQTMNIINGLIAIPLMNVFGFSLVQAVNFAVVTAFALGGLFMFWFIYKLVKSYWVGIIAGGLFTFSSFHFAHAIGHMQLITLQFIPLFLLAFWTLLEKVRYRHALLAGGALFLVLLSDYYYLFWCIILGAMWFCWKLYQKELKLNKQNIRVLIVFALFSGILVLPLVGSLVMLSKSDPLQGSHNATQFGLDLLSPVIPGGSWYWGSLTQGYWNRLQFTAETSVFFGFGLLTVLAVAFYKMILKRKDIKTPNWLYFWWIVFVVFGVMSLGPRLTIFGKTLDRVPMPYALVERLFPTLKISGMPVRWVLVVLIAAIVISSYVLAQVNTKTRKGQLLILVFALVSFIDLRPIMLPLTDPNKYSQPYVNKLKELPAGIVIDNGAKSGEEQLFHQTIHGKQMAFGYVTRLPQSTADKSFEIFADLEEGRLEELCRDQSVRYLTTPASRPLKRSSFPIIYNDKQTLIYDLKNSDNC